MKRITISEVNGLLDSGEDVTVIDSRSEKAWEASGEKAAGAVRIPPDEAEKHLADLSSGHPIIVYCT